MKTFKGTKGEWEYCHSEMNPKKHGLAIIGDNGSRLIADIYRTPSQGEEKAEANAKLIAEAPEMLRVLQLLIDDNVIQDSHYLDVVEETVNNALK